jgi:riboflavin kinase / FMN adenylyltransferase
LIRRLVEEAHQTQRSAVVLTFFPHPDVVLRDLSGRFYLSTSDQRAMWLEDLGVDVVVTHPFDDEIRHIRAAEFVDRLQSHLKMSSLWATADFAMGYEREGTIDFLREQGVLKGFDVQTVEWVMADGSGGKISSEAIRQALEAGDLTKANEYLGRPYQLSGEVVHGEKRGRQIGFPTANVETWDKQILPANGVYACRAYLGKESFMAVTNIGKRPTFDGQAVTIEAHLLDFDRDIYGETLSILWQNCVMK